MGDIVQTIRRPQLVPGTFAELDRYSPVARLGIARLGEGHPASVCTSDTTTFIVQRKADLRPADAHSQRLPRRLEGVTEVSRCGQAGTVGVHLGEAHNCHQLALRLADIQITRNYGRQVA